MPGQGFSGYLLVCCSLCITVGPGQMWGMKREDLFFSFSALNLFMIWQSLSTSNSPAYHFPFPLGASACSAIWRETEIQLFNKLAYTGCNSFRSRFTHRECLRIARHNCWTFPITFLWCCTILFLRHKKPLSVPQSISLLFISPIGCIWLWRKTLAGQRV